MTDTKYPLQNYFFFDKFSSSHRAFLASISSSQESKSFSLAMKYAHWRDAMADEIKDLELNHTWSIMLLPPCKHVIRRKWVYKIKYKFDGSIK